MKDSTLAISLAGLSFMLTVIWGGPLLRVLRHFKIGKLIRVEEPGKHMVKMGTPTMGGVMVVLPVLLLTALLNAVELIGLKLAGQSVLVPMATLVAFALLGAIDDWEGLRGKRRGDGLSIRAKFVAQWVLAGIVAWALKYLLGVPDARISALAAEDPLPDLGTWWEGFLTYVPPWLGGQRWVETTLTTKLTGQRLVAKYDLILSGEDGSLTIFDWKTAQRAPGKAHLLERMQTRLYRLMLVQASSTFFAGQPAVPGQITMNYWFATHPENPVSLPYSQAAYEQDQEDLTRLVEVVCSATREDFVRTDDHKKCRYCVYRSHCDRGVEAGDLDAYDLLDEDTDGLETLPALEDLPEIEF